MNYDTSISYALGLIEVFWIGTRLDELFLASKVLGRGIKLLVLVQNRFDYPKQNSIGVCIPDLCR